MKSINQETLKRIIKEEIAQAIEDDYIVQPDKDDYEADMVKSHLTSMCEQTEELNQMIESGENIEEWVQEKIAVANSMIDSVYHYLKYEKGSHEQL